MKTHEPSVWLACLALLCSLGAVGAAEEVAVVKQPHVNVRGQPSLVGEVITQLQQGEKVVVLEEVPALRPKTNEPARWAKIQMPPKTPVWVYAPYIDAASKSVKVSRLNLRAGPGENFSVVGRLQRGTVISEIRRADDWIEIETPPGAYAFVAAELLGKPDAVAVAETKTEPAVTAPAPTVVTVPSVQPSAPSAPTPSPAAPDPGSSVTSTPQPTPAVSVPPAMEPSAPTTVPARELTVKTEPSPVTPAAAAPEPDKSPVSTQNPLVAAALVPPTSAPEAAAPAAPAAESAAKLPEGAQRRVVRREGLVRSTVSIQAPTYYELLSPENRKTINYLHADNVKVNLKDYRGRRIVVTGEEALDPRWPKTPVIEVETLELIP